MSSSGIIVQNITYHYQFEDSSNERNELSFETNMTPFERNQFRRTLMNKTTVPAIDSVYIISNKTLFADEQVVSRLSLIPINPTSNINLVEKDKCDCEHSCHRCALYIEFEIVSKSPVIYSHDISPYFYPGMRVFYCTKNNTVLSGIIKVTRKSPKNNSKWSIPVLFQFDDISESNYYRIILSSDLPYNLNDVLLDVLNSM